MYFKYQSIYITDSGLRVNYIHDRQYDCYYKIEIHTEFAKPNLKH